MNRARSILIVGFLAAIAAGVLIIFQRSTTPEPAAPIPTPLPVATKTATSPTPPAPTSEVKAQPSQTTGGGKFSSAEANNPKRTPRLPALTPAEAESRIMEALNLAKEANGKFRLGRMEIDPAKRSLTIPAKVQIRQGQLEYALVHESGKTHESLFSTSVTPHELHIGALLLRGVGMAPSIEIVWDTNGPPARHDLAKLIKVSGEQPDLLITSQWNYSGSGFNGSNFAAQTEGSCIALITDGTALVGPAGNASGTRDDLFTPQSEMLPPAGAMVRVVMTFPAASQ